MQGGRDHDEDGPRHDETRLLRAALESLEEGLVVHAADGRIVSANGRAERLLGLTKREIFGRDSFDPAWGAIREDGSPFPGEEHPAMVALRTGLPQLGVIMGVHRPDGGVSWLRVNARPLFHGGAARPSGVAASFTDITETRRLQSELRERDEQRRALLLDSFPFMVWLKDREGRFLAVNQSFARAAGVRSAEEVVGKTDLDLWPRDLAESYRADDEEVMRTGKNKTREEAVEQGGKRTWIETYKAPVLRDDGGILGTVGLARDLTARRVAERRIRASEERLRATLESTPNVAVQWWDAQGRLLYANRASENAFGGAAAEMVGRSVEEVSSDARAAEALRAVLGHLAAGGGMVGPTEIMHRHPSGAPRTVLSTAFTIPGELPGEQVFVSMGVDITAEKEAVAAAARGQALIESLFDAIPDPVWLKDREGQYLAANRAFCRLYGTTLEGLLGRRDVDFVDAPTADFFRKNDLAAMAAGKARSNEEWLTYPDGSRTFVETTKTPVQAPDGALLGVLGVARDITERKRAEEALSGYKVDLERLVELRSAEAATFRTLVDQSPEGFALVDTGTLEIVYANAALARMFGYPDRGSMVGLRAEALMRDGSAGELAQHPPSHSAGGWAGDIRARRRDGSTFDVSATAFTIPDPGGRLIIAATVRDITEKRRAEDALKASRDELSLSNLELEKAVSAKDEFLASMSHELRTPLSSMLMLSEALQEGIYGPLSPRQRQSLATLDQSGRHLLDLIGDILDLAKIGAAQLGLEESACDVPAIGEAALQLVSGLARKKELVVSFHCSPARLTTRGDPRRLKQILVNLLGNAVKFTPRAGRIGLRVEGDQEGEVIRLLVWDNGPGIAAADQARLFKPFTQLDSRLARDHGGSGLGLALVRALVDLHGGSVSLDSAPGAGSRFTVQLPWITPAEEPRSPARSPLPPSLGAVGRRVLLAEDNPVSAAGYADYLRARGLLVDRAADGVEALEMACRLKPDLVLMDVQMPGLDGLEVIRRLRADADPRVAGVPIVALTALVMAGDRERCLTAGASAYLSKPVRLAELLRTIDGLLGVTP